MPLPHSHAAHAPHGAHAHAGSVVWRGGLTRMLLPLLNATSLLAFLTWFGAAGYVLRHVVGWPLLAVLPIALLAGIAAATLIGWFMTKLAAGERVMDPEEYRLVGTSGRLTVSIPSDGVGEVVFSKGGTRRSEAARSLSGRALARGTEVVIISYTRG